MLAAALEARGADVRLQEIRAGEEPQSSGDYLVLLFAVHAFNAPLPVYRWLKALKAAGGTNAAVIAVSGGGEMSPNTACRLSCIRRLKKKGYNVIYEDSVVMPSNVLAATPKGASARLIRALPEKAAMMADDILAGREKRLKAKLFDRFMSRIGEGEKPGVKLFGKLLKAGERCNGCGLCARGCPEGNIRMDGDRPVYGSRCCMCLRCVYACPERAIYPKCFKFLILKDGPDIKGLDESDATDEADDLKGAAWKGVREYLEDLERQSK